jgi:hypothetical protein
MNNSAEQKKRETIVDTRNPEVWHRTAKERVWQKKKADWEPSERCFFLKFFFQNHAEPGLPDGLYSNSKIPFWVNFGGPEIG